MTPLEFVEATFKFPSYIIPHPIQIQVINALAPLNNAGYWLDMGTGKTFCSTAAALYHRLAFGHIAVVIMPPLLIRQWSIWLRSITPPLNVVEYKGAPSERRRKDIDCDFLLVGSQIFKKDFSRLLEHFHGKAYTLIVDEANMLSNIESQTHKQIYDFAIGRATMLLTGTPANNPMSVFGLLKFTAPGTYLHFQQFQRLHVKYVTTFGKPVEFQNIELLASNLLTNARRVLFEDMYSDAEEPLYSPINYELEPDHYKIYKRLAEEAIVRLPPNDKINFFSIQRLIHALGQIVVNLGHFSVDPTSVSNSIHLVHEKLAELGDGKLVVFANYKKSVAAVLQYTAKFGALAINSEVSASQKQSSIEEFKRNPKCRVLIVQFKSGGYGLDGLQHVCNHCLFIEPCQQPRDFHQAVARLKRIGQAKRVMVYMAVAEGTLQVRGFESLLKNDSLVNRIVRGGRDLRESLFGDSLLEPNGALLVSRSDA